MCSVLVYNLCKLRAYDSALIDFAQKFNIVYKAQYAKQVVLCLLALCR